MLKYRPYPANDGKHKYYLITNDNKKVYFGAAGMSDFTQHKNEDRKNLYINRHKRVSLNFGINQELIHLHFGPDFYCGRNQQEKKVMNILK